MVTVQLDRVGDLGLVLFLAALGALHPLGGVRSRAGGGVLAWVVAGSVGVPFAVGTAVAVTVGGPLTGHGGHRLADAAFLGIAVSVTALPVLGRILLDQRMDSTPVAAVAVRAAAVGDGLAWVALAVLLVVASATSSHPRSVTAAAPMVLPALSLLVRGLLAHLEASGHRWRGDQAVLGLLAVGAVAAGAAGELTGLHPALGAFVFGLALPRHCEPVRRALHRLQEISLVLLLPVFFAGIGLGIDLTDLGAYGQWGIVAALVLAAVATKILGAGVGARLGGLPGPQAWRVGVLMNCRGVTELVIATIGLRHGLISPLGFTALVLVAALTTASTCPLLRLTQRWPDPPALIGARVAEVPA